MIANYHTHTKWCNHAEGEIEEYILKAIECGLEEIAITEHVCLDMASPRRLKWQDFNVFNAELDKMIEKYGSQISVIKGFECEYFPHYMHMYQKMRDQYGYELFLLGHHESIDRDFDFFQSKTKEEVNRYVDEIVEGIKTGFFQICAHPDFIITSYKEEDDFYLNKMREIYKACEEHNVIVEINANGFRYNRGYPSFKALEISKEYNLRYIIGSDCHLVKDLYDESCKELEKIILSMGITYIDKLDKETLK